MRPIRFFIPQTFANLKLIIETGIIRILILFIIAIIYMAFATSNLSLPFGFNPAHNLHVTLSSSD